jgi:Uma2 family endonuclease
MATAFGHNVHYSYAEYLTLEATSNVKHEYLGGQIYAMAGGSPEHAALQAAAIGILFKQLDGGRCRPHSSDLHVRVLATGLGTYPDVTVVCGPTERDPEHPQTVVNPTVILEVLSNSTESYDRTEKFEHYKQIPSLQHYVLVSHTERTLEVWSRAGEAWSQSIVREGESANLTAIGATFDVRELYDRAAEPTG